jgi:hypothetical protein
MELLDARTGRTICAIAGWVENGVLAGTLDDSVCALNLDSVLRPPVQPRGYAAPKITYLDDDNNPTVKLRALSQRSTTLIPVSADDTWFNPTLQMVSPRELRVRRMARWTVAGVVAISAVVLGIAAEQPPHSVTLGADHQRVDLDVGEIVGPESRAGETMFVDDVAVGKVGAIKVECGVRSVRVGDKGASRKIDVPCGGRITL